MIAYDTNTVPEGTTAQDIIKIMQNTKVLFYDSTIGMKPTVLESDEDIKFIDTTTKKGKELLNKYK